MAPVPFLKKPSSLAILLAIVLAGTYVYGFVWGGPAAGTSTIDLLLDLLFFVLLLMACAFFYAQFILPVRTAAERRRILAHLFLHARGSHGPAIFIENGRRIEREGEEERSGAAVLWIDTASAVMVRSSHGLKRALGPGIHFLDKDERVAATFSLHRQSVSLGPEPGENAFAKLTEEASAEERHAFEALQAKRSGVSGRTRDGHEVVPRISLVFKLDAKPAVPGHPGSRFGFLREAVEAAAVAEGIRPGANGETTVHVAWNQLPGLIAADVWREYLAKFTLDELFSQHFPPLPDILQPEEPVRENSVPVTPLVVRRDWGARVLHRLNDHLQAWVDGRDDRHDPKPPGEPMPRADVLRRHGAPQALTALQVIGQMMRARMMQAVVPILDECGRLQKGHAASEEYRQLRERGLAVLDVSLEGLQFDPSFEEQIVQQWNSAWLSNATEDRRRVEQLELLAGEGGKRAALLEHAGVLARAVRTTNPQSIDAAVRSLLQASRNEVLTDERISARGKAEVDALSELMKWLEAGPRD
jgi:hypothetical protein